jgi:hypothetical protein
MVGELEGFKDFSLALACSQPLPMQQILPETVQNCQNLPKDNKLEKL